ncbi:hypothetical protein F2Q68_00019179 [Brassica cretica]|uniref:RNase H type-1 domain-containing protein n=2 Tax=Brassica cretica TaxID=69181 RepID=A0A3N6RJN8_BRACR|nr:hypothetical protein F2Q68_00019179 [Brassica cretica]
MWRKKFGNSEKSVLTWVTPNLITAKWWLEVIVILNDNRWPYCVEDIHIITRIESHVSSPCIAEALAIRVALYHAISLHFTHICLSTDCQVLVRALSSGCRSSIVGAPRSDGGHRLHPLVFCICFA